ncbi:hypothetical protein GCM10027093_65000 [Paraburkholderia jirisanensis]
MPSFHVGELIHTAAHDAQIDAAMRDRAVAQNTGGARTGPLVQPHALSFGGREQSAAASGHSVLRLRGGGGALGKGGGMDDDNRHLLRTGGNSGTYDVAGRAELNAREMNEAQFAARRSDLQWRLDKADSEMNEATHRHRLATEQRGRLKADIERLEHEKGQASPNSPRVAQIDAQLRNMNSSYDRQLEVLLTHQTAVMAAGRKYFRIKQELALLRRT